MVGGASKLVQGHHAHDPARRREGEDQQVNRRTPVHNSWSVPTLSSNARSPGPACKPQTRLSSNVYPGGHSRTPWFEPILSSNVSITWGARTHPSRAGGPRIKRPADCLPKLSSPAHPSCPLLLCGPEFLEFGSSTFVFAPMANGNQVHSVTAGDGNSNHQGL